MRLRKGGAGAIRAHLRYLQRGGVQRDGSAGDLYDGASGAADGKAFADRCQGDRHQFRLIVSAEDGDAYEDLKPLVRRFMTQMAKDLGTGLEWVAVDHVDTAHPHSHIILRGRDERGGNLVISREYISHGMRERVSELVTIDLGPRREEDIRRRLRAEIQAERLTSIDRSLLASVGASRVVSPTHRDPFRHALRAGRLKKLERLGLAHPLDHGRWQLAEGADNALKHLGERGDIIRTMQRSLTAKGIERAPAETVYSEEPPRGGLVGRLVSRGLLDELSGGQYLILDGIDGRAHCVGIGETVEPIPDNAILKVHAGRDGGRPNPAVAQSGVQAAARPLRQRSTKPKVEILSPVALEKLAGRTAATWLDSQLAGEEPVAARDSGFGKEVRSALVARRAWLLANGFAEEVGDGLAFLPGSLEALAKREIEQEGARLARELKLSFAPADAPFVEGRLTRRVDLAQGRFALLEKSQEFTLVPWKPSLERELGNEIAGHLRQDGAGWTLHPARSIER